MNEVIKALLERRSIRNFKKEMPSQEEIDQILEAGLYAASGRGSQNTICLVVRNKDLRKKLQEDNCAIWKRDPGIDPFYGAPLIIIVLAPSDSDNGAYDGSLVLGNMMLAAHAIGLGSVWINRARQEFEREDYKRILKDMGIKGEWTGVGHLAVGYIDGEYPKASERKANRVFYID